MLLQPWLQGWRRRAGNAWRRCGLAEKRDPVGRDAVVVVVHGCGAGTRTEALGDDDPL